MAFRGRRPRVVTSRPMSGLRDATEGSHDKSGQGING